jgi:hypothetical protein
MTIEDDPDQMTSALGDDWVPHSPLSITAEESEGKLSPLNYLELKTGDFVDVMIQPDIVTRQAGTSVTFSFERIVVLKTRENVNVIHRVRS